MSCGATRRNGCACSCSQYIKHEKDEKCLTCKHLRSIHVAESLALPTSQETTVRLTVSEVLNKYREYTDKLQVKATNADACFEAGLGFHIESEKKWSSKWKVSKFDMLIVQTELTLHRMREKSCRSLPHHHWNLQKQVPWWCYPGDWK